MLLTLRSASSSASETASEKASQCLRDCFGRPLTPSHLVPCPHSVFMWPSETAFWHPQMLLTLRSASSSASETASEGLSRHLTSSSETASEKASQCLRDCFGRPLTRLTLRLARTPFLFLWPSETLLRKASHASHLVPCPHSVFVFMTVRNCFLAPSNAPNPP